MTRAPTPDVSTGGAGARRVFLSSGQLGCPANLALSTRLHNYVAANRWTLADAASAGCLVVVACSILVEYRRTMAAAVRYLARRYPGKPVLVTGCFVAEDVVDAPNVAYVGMSELDELDAWFGRPGVPLRDVPEVSTAEDDVEVGALRDARAVFERPYNVLVETGCLSHCHYCLERNLFPRVRSVPLPEVVARCRDGVRKGYTNFVIGGTDVASYGHDLGHDVADLFAALFTQVFGGHPELGVGFKALEPSRFIRHFAALRTYFETCRIDWIYLPIESGSDRVLQTMNRRYRVDDVLRVVAELRAIAPRLRIETDFVICYPTETAEEFEASLRLRDRFDHWNLVVFDRHEHTRAFAMPDEFSPEERARRCGVVEALNESAARSYRPECRTLAELPLAEPPGGSGLYTLSRHLAREPV